MWPFSAQCQSKARLLGKTVIITGANTGIGKETAKDLYRRGARVILACRNLQKANEAAEEVKNKLPSKPEREQFQGEPGEVQVCRLDLNSLSSVRECAQNLHATEAAMHVLINNAGVMMCPYSKTEDGFETQLQTNHLGHFLFTLLLLPKIRTSGPGCRIVNVSSMAYKHGNIHFDDINLEKSYSPSKAYCQSKLANVLFAKELDKRLKEAKIDNITTYSLHPGVITTELSRHFDTFAFRGFRALTSIFAGPFMKTPEQGAQTTIYCSVAEECSKESGLYYQECAVRNTTNRAKDANVAAKLWNESMKMVGLEPEDNLEELLKKIEKDILPPRQGMLNNTEKDVLSSNP